MNKSLKRTDPSVTFYLSNNRSGNLDMSIHDVKNVDAWTVDIKKPHEGRGGRIRLISVSDGDDVILEINLFEMEANQ